MFISPAQTAFVKGRSISEAVLLAHEVLSRSHLSTCQTSLMCLKIDLAKACDSLDWRYLLTLLDQLGFSSHWCQLIGTMLRTSFQIKLNGTLSSTYSATNGLRQGDPLSPYLFVIAMEGFSRMMERGVQAQKIIPLKRRNVEISHTMYADDLMIFAEATTHTATHIRSLLDRFTLFSGLQANYQKCSVIFGGPPAPMDEILQILDMPQGVLPTTYLGLPLVTTSFTVDTCQPLVAKVRAKLLGWAAKLLSFAGRVALVRSVMSSMHLYWSSCYRNPEATVYLAGQDTKDLMEEVLCSIT